MATAGALLSMQPMQRMQRQDHVPDVADASPGSSQDAILSFIQSVQKDVTPLLQAPPRRHRHEIPDNFTPRRSDRIAKADRGLDSGMKAKRVLLLRLGLLKDDDPVNPEALDKYAKLFQQPLDPDVIQAFAEFYGWVWPPRGLPLASTAITPA